jgi:hypothetical protein
MLANAPRPLRSLLAGVAGTAALTASYAIERRARHRWGRSLDYDDSLVPGQIVVSILHLGHVTGREEDKLGLALRWSYGSAFGLAHGLLRRWVPEPAATGVFGSALMTMTATMFPVLGRTPPPWCWPRGFRATSLATHAAYAVTVGVTDDRLARAGRPDGGG